MKTYLKLVHFELHRFRYFLLGLMAITGLAQTGITITEAFQARRVREMADTLDHLSKTSYRHYDTGKTSFADMIHENLQTFSLPVLLCIVALVLYVFLIWYRDWFGRGAMIYRLLMLPSPRACVYWSKLTTILVSMFALLSWQLVLLVGLDGLFNRIVPATFRVPIDFTEIISANQVFDVLFPTKLEDFILSYGMGMVALLVAFTSVLLERSKRRIGLVFAVLYAGGATVLLLSMIAGYDLKIFDYLYEHELIWLVVGGWLLTGVFSAWLGLRLLNRKISV